MATRLITEIGGAYSNSYVTLEQANSIAKQYPWKGQWEALSDDQKISALISTTLAMNTLPWKGTKCFPASDAGHCNPRYDQYWNKSVQNPEGVFEYFEEAGVTTTGMVQGADIIDWGQADLFDVENRIRIEGARLTTPTFYDSSDTEVTPDTGSDAAGGDPLDYTAVFDDGLSFGRFVSGWVDLLNPLTGASITGIYIDGEKLRNKPSVGSQTPQRLAWPRTGVCCGEYCPTCGEIPVPVMEAQVMMAMSIALHPEYFPSNPIAPDLTPKGLYVKRNKIGSLEQEFAEWSGPTGLAPCDNCNVVEILKNFPWLDDYLNCWLDKTSGGNSGLRLRVRS